MFDTTNLLCQSVQVLLKLWRVLVESNKTKSMVPGQVRQERLVVHYLVTLLRLCSCSMVGHGSAMIFGMEQTIERIQDTPLSSAGGAILMVVAVAIAAAAAAAATLRTGKRQLSPVDLLIEHTRLRIQLGQKGGGGERLKMREGGHAAGRSHVVLHHWHDPACIVRSSTGCC